MPDYRISRGLFDDLAADVATGDFAAIQAKLRAAHVLMPRDDQEPGIVLDVARSGEAKVQSSEVNDPNLEPEPKKKRKRRWPF